MPDRLTDAAHLQPKMGVGETLPCRNDPRRVRAQLSHVHEIDPVRIPVQGVAQHDDAGRRNRDQDWLSGSPTLPDERDSPGNELLVGAPEECLVPIPVMGAAPVSWARPVGSIPHGRGCGAVDGFLM